MKLNKKKDGLLFLVDYLIIKKRVRFFYQN